MSPSVPMVVVAGSIVASFALAGMASESEARGYRTFFLTVDAVPYTSVAALHASGGAPELFDELGGPVPLISTFPSTTTVALGAALRPLGLEASPGYEARFFDWDKGSVRGGGLISYFKIDFPWRDFFQWSKKGVVRSAVASLRPIGASEGRALAAFEAFLTAKEDNYFAYVETTDTAAHLRGAATLDNMFSRLGRAIRAARVAGKKFRVVVFSDHGIAGGEPLENVLGRIETALEAARFKRTKSLRGVRDVVLTPYGLVSSFEAYAKREAVPRLAQVLASSEGVGLCAYRIGRELRVAASDALAAIERRDEEWTYRPLTGDPLRYGAVVDRLRLGESRPSQADWFSDREWFEATRDEFYPDALHRIAGGFELVTNPASVLCSLEPGYMYGPKRTERAARLAGGRLRWTHGALFWEASAGFLLTDVPRPGGDGGQRLAAALSPLLSGFEQKTAAAHSPGSAAINVGSR